MTIRSLSRFFAATLLLPLLTGCFLTPQSGGQDTPPPSQTDDKDQKDAAPQNGGNKDVSDAASTGKALFNGLKDGATSVEQNLGLGKLKLPGDPTGPLGAASTALKVVAVGTKIMDAYNDPNGGVGAAFQTAAVEGCKHVISSYVAPAVTTAVTGFLTTVAAPLVVAGTVSVGGAAVVIGVAAAAAGYGARYAVGKAVDAAAPYVKSAATSVGNAVDSVATTVGNSMGNALVETLTTKDPSYGGVENDTPTLPNIEANQQEENRRARDKWFADEAERNRLNEMLNQASRNLTPRTMTIPVCVHPGGN